MVCYRIKVLVYVCFVLSIMVSQVPARTIMVDAGGEGEFTLIQAAIDAAVSGADEIVVAPGTYYEAINFDGKAVHLLGSAGAAATLIDGTGHYHVVQCVSGEGAGTILEGFTITGGNANGPADADKRGGGMYVSGSSPTVRHCAFRNNAAADLGGGMYSTGGSVSYCSFIGNNAGTSGGGMYHIGNASVSHCTFTGNQATNGGGLANRGDTGLSLTVNDCTFTDNQGTYGGGMHNSPGSFDVSPNVVRCTFTGNQATDGGGIYTQAGSSFASKPKITNCIFDSNTAMRGAGMFNTGTYGTYMGLYDSKIEPTITNGLFLNNSASSSSAVYNYFSIPTFSFCTFYNNVGGGIYSALQSTTTVRNSIVWNVAMNGIAHDSGSSTTVIHSNVQGGYAGEGNMDVYPIFANPAAGDLRLTWYSACLDAAHPLSSMFWSPPTADLAGNARFVGVADMGAYELPAGSTRVGQGTISVTIEPDEAVAAGARWRIEGQSQWRTSGAAVKMAPGYHTVEFTELTEWFEPRNVEVCYDADDERAAVRNHRVRVIGDVTASVSGKYRPLPVYEIGQIPPAQAPHGSVLEFFADAGAPGNAAFSAEPSFDPRYPAPLGTIAIDPQTGRFTYEPDVNDRAAFDVTFSASAGGDPVEQTVQITPLADPVEEYDIVSRPVQALPDPLSRDYIFVNDMKSNGNERLNGLDKTVRSVTVAAIEITVDDTPKNLIYGYNGNTDIKDLTIYAGTLIVRKPLWLPQTGVTVYARHVIFEDGGERTHIRTTPNEWRAEGARPDSLSAGNINLFLEGYSAPGGLKERFVMDGTKGNSTYGQGGRLTCSLDASSPLSWLSPYALKMVVAHARDAYLYGYMPQTREILEQYDELLGVASRLQQQNQPASRQFELEQMRQEITTLIHRLDNNLDYFGNPSDWVPALSFEVLKATYEQEIRRAIRVLYLSYWLNNRADQITDKAAWLANCRDRLWDETEQSRLELANYYKLIGPLEKWAGEIAAKIGRADGGECFGLLCELKNKEAQLLARAEQKEHGWQKALESLVTITTATLTGASRTGQAGAVLGAASGLMVVGQDVFMEPDPWEAAGRAANIAQRFNSTNYKEATGAWQGQFEAVDLAGLEANGADAYLQDLHASAKNMADGLWQVKETLGATRIDDEAADAELKRLKASNPTFRRLIDEVFALTIEKQVFSQQLAAAMQKASTLSNAMTNNVLAIDAMNRDASEINRIFDDRVLMYAKDMERRAVARLKKYHYYMAKAYEYRFLEPYPGDLNVGSIFQAMANLVSYDVTLESDDFDSLAAVYEAQLSELANDIMEDFLAGHVEKNVEALYKLSAEEIGRLNTGEPLTLNLFARGLFPTDLENIRIVAIKVHDIDVDVAGDCGGWGYIKLKMTHPSVSKLQRGDNIYRFRHFSPGREAFEVMWESHYYPQFNPPYLGHVSTSVASQSLLGSLLNAEYQPDMLIYSRPGAWADIVITKEDEKEGPCRLDIQTMWLKLEYDYYGKDAAVHTLRVAAEPKELAAHFLVDAPDLSDRRDGTGDFYRIYDWNVTSTINVTAPATYGHYRFDKWTNRLGETLGSQPTRQVSLEPRTGRKDQTVRAHYVYEGPIPSEVDFNEDYWVDYQDFAALSRGWLTGPSAPEWDGRFDINEDGVIDMYELLMFAEEWLMTP